MILRPLILVALVTVALVRVDRVWSGPRAPSNGYALIAGVSRYTGGLRPIGSATSDARALAGALKDPLAVGRPFSIAGVFLDDQVTHSSVLNLLRELQSTVKASDIFLMYWAGHLTRYPPGGTEMYLGLGSWNVDRPLPDQGISFTELARELKGIRARARIVILQSGPGGTTAGGGPAGVAGPGVDALIERGDPRSIVAVITSSNESDTGPGRFTATLIEGVTGKADGYWSEGERARDGQVSLSELFDYVHDQVVKSPPRDGKRTVVQEPRLTFAGSGLDHTYVTWREPVVSSAVPKEPLPSGAIVRLGSVDWTPVCSSPIGLLGLASLMPDGRSILLHGGSGGGTGSVMDPSTGRTMRTIEPAIVPPFPGLSRDGRLVALTDREGALGLWDTERWVPSERLPSGKLHISKSDWTDAIVATAFSPDGRQAVATYLGTDTARVWDLVEKKISTTRAAYGAPHCVRFHPTERSLVSIGPKGHGLIVRGWPDGKNSHRFAERKAIWFDLSPDGKLVALRDARSLEVLEWATGRRLWGFSHPGIDVAQLLKQMVLEPRDSATNPGPAPLSSVCFSADGRQVWSLDEEGRLALWDAGSGRKTQSFRVPFHQFNLVSSTRDGRFVLRAGVGKVDLYDLELDRCLSTGAGHRGHVESVVPVDETETVVSSGSDGTVRVWSTRSGEEAGLLPDASAPGRVIGSLSGRNAVAVWSRQGLSLVAVGGRKVLWSIAASRRTTGGFSLDTDGQRVASFGANVCTVWDVRAAPAEVTELRHDNQVRSVAFVRSRRDLLTLDSDNTLRRWDPGQPTSLATLHFEAADRLSAGGSWVLNEHSRGLSIFDTADGLVLGKYDRSEPISCIAFSHDEQAAALGYRDGTIRVFDLQDFRERDTYRGHHLAVTALGFSRNGKTLFSGSADTTIIAWDLGRALSGPGGPERQPDRPKAASLLERARSHARERRTTESIGWFEQAVRADPGLTEAWIELGDAFATIEPPDDTDSASFAVTAAAVAGRRSPLNPRVWQGYGDVLFKLHRWDQAAIAYRRALKIDPPCAECWLNLGLALRTGEEAVTAFGRSIILGHAPARAWLGLGRALLAAKSYDKAEESLRKGLEQSENDPEAWLDLGRALLGQKKRAEARAALQKALALDPAMEAALEEITNLDGQTSPEGDRRREPAAPSVQASSGAITTTVSTARELIEAIGPNRTIRIKPGTYDLTARKGLTTPYVSWAEETDGPELRLKSVKRLTLVGVGSPCPKIIVSPRHADVMEISDAEDLTLANLVMGHAPEGECSGNVLTIGRCSRVRIERCVLFGCGTYGLDLMDVSDFRMTDSEIRDCTYGIMTLSRSSGVTFQDCRFRRNREFDLIGLEQCRAVLFERCSFVDNAVRVAVAHDRRFLFSFSSECREPVTLKECLLKGNCVDALTNRPELIKVSSPRPGGQSW